MSIGDQLDVDIADLLDFFALDPRPTRSSSIRGGQGRTQVHVGGARGRAGQPIVVVKSGRMAQGAKAAATHTGALAGSDAVYDAAFRRAGMLRVFDLRELFDCAETLGRVRPPQGKRLAILTNGGGIGVLVVDRLVELGGIPATLSPDVRRQLDAVLPPTWSGANPVDIVGDADAARYAAALEVLLADPDNDAVLVMNVHTAIAPASEIASTVARVVGVTARSARRRSRSRGVGRRPRGASTSPSTDRRFPSYPTRTTPRAASCISCNTGEVTTRWPRCRRACSRKFVPDADTARAIVATRCPKAGAGSIRLRSSAVRGLSDSDGADAPAAGRR